MPFVCLCAVHLYVCPAGESVPGIPDELHLTRIYAAIQNLPHPIPRLNFYQALSCFRIASILQVHIYACGSLYDIEMISRVYVFIVCMEHAMVVSVCVTPREFLHVADEGMPVVMKPWSMNHWLFQWLRQASIMLLVHTRYQRWHPFIFLQRLRKF